MTYKITVLFLVAILVNQGNADDNYKLPKGHLKPLGQHRAAEGHIDVLNEPISAEEFWSKYVGQRRPVLLKQAALDFPAIDSWTDDYLRNFYGNYWIYSAKINEKEEISNDQGHLERQSLNDFISTYVNESKCIDSQLPQPMQRDVLIPPFLSCGSFTTAMIDVHVWLNTGNSKSSLRKDASNTINCLLNGTSDWILIDNQNAHLVPMVEEIAKDGSTRSALQVDEVDLQKYSAFSNCPYYDATLAKGDCIYLPHDSLYQVRTDGVKNMRVSLLFSQSVSHLKKFNNQDCQTSKYKNIRDPMFDWQINSHTTPVVDLQDPNLYREAAFQAFKGKKKIRTEVLLRRLKIRKNLQIENKNVVTTDEIADLPLQSWINLIYYFDLDPENPLKYEYRIYTKKDIRSIIEKTIDKAGGINTRKFAVFYEKLLSGSEQSANEIMRKFDTNGNGKVSKEERLSKLDEVLGLFANPDGKVDEIDSNESDISDGEDPLRSEETELKKESAEIGNQGIPEQTDSGSINDEMNEKKSSRDEL
ncbi:uncharacterized protein TRIADDRAFT_57500 [Trichoplax adhaerens]|uniref:JmjC domain-containing protein n=1 Tax=Trichoplax adhaerens TaxID=10228 RepID=B3RZL5_TRIAD|nr:hypothetical protein TRIADDRAFT_57500 [Trichoplax adhaerens]EDV24230.1 hypothetical protein TRIADDRAFT_57500 [Trichoplax adhaerens]|eukprot:XP_002113756.1 hypothetical protein TRIADDRAFT_57500 [Trichoplax adhaerens]